MSMSSSKKRVTESEEMNDKDALKHSRTKYQRFNNNDGDDGNNDEKQSKSKNSTNDHADSGDNDGEGPSNVDMKEYESKHTLDSDEEEDVKYKKLDINKIEGQEVAGIEFEGNTKITPFNMEEDLEEGHFDTDGSFIFNKKERDIKDAWLDNIDWAHIKKAAGDNWQKNNDDVGDESDVKTLGMDQLKSIYEKLSTLLQPNETIEKALKRLGKQHLSAAEERKRRWAAKKAGQKYEDESSVNVKELTGLADSLVSKGEMEVYQYTKEKLQVLIDHINNKGNKIVKSAVDQVDIFSDTSSASAKESTTEATKVADDSVKWEYKLSDKDDAQILGPFSSEEMLKLQHEGKFDGGGWARKFGTSSFYTVARVDFELYT